MFDLCAPAIIYLIFSLIQILLDTMKGMYNTAFMKGIVAMVVTFLLNLLCVRGMGVVSWIIVFLPFLFMTVIVTLLLYVFGLDASTGKLKTLNPQQGNVAVPKDSTDTQALQKEVVVLH